MESKIRHHHDLTLAATHISPLVLTLCLSAFSTISLVGTASAQNPDWMVFTSQAGINAIAISGQSVWAGGTGLFKIEKATGNITVYSPANSGLLCNNLKALAVDASGNLWIGTAYKGLVEFDGTNWTVYNTTNSGLPSNFITTIAIDNLGDKWIGTNGGGLAKFDGTHWMVYNEYNSDLPGDTVTSIAVDRSGKLWVGAERFWNGRSYVGGLAELEGTSWTVYDTGNSALPSEWITAIAIDSAGNKWIGTVSGLAKFDGKNWAMYNTGNSGLPSNVVSTIAIDGSGNEWIGTDKGLGLVKFDGINWTTYTYNNKFGTPLAPWSPSVIAIDDSGNKWVPSYLGLSKFDGRNWTFYKTGNVSLPIASLSALALDASGTKWIGTDGAGLVKFDGTNWTLYDTTNSGLTSNFITAIAIDNSGNRWIGTNYNDFSSSATGGLIKFDGTNWTTYNRTNSPLGNDVNAIAIDPSGNKWIGTEHMTSTGSIVGDGLAKFDGSVWTIYNKGNSGLLDNDVFAIAVGDSGNLWIGTIYSFPNPLLGAGGLYKFDGRYWTVYNTGISIGTLATDKSGNVWMGTSAGFGKFDGTNWAWFGPDTSAGLPFYIAITAIAVDSQGNEWIGTGNGGLARFDGTKCTMYNTDNSDLPNNWVTAIAIDSRGNKWIATHNGLAVYRQGGVVLSVNDKRMASLPTLFELSQNFPNPFNPSTNINYRLPVAADVILKVYDVLGREVKTLVNGHQTAGIYSVKFNASNLASGVYFYTLQAGSYHDTKKLLLLK